MSDIVERLRQRQEWTRAGERERLCEEAADEIERLRLALAEEQARYPEAYIREAEAQIERLRAPPTEAEVEAAAEAIFHTEYDRDECQWLDYEAVIYRKMARAALEVAAKVRGGG